MRTILVPVDFTEFSENAVRMAGDFAGIKGMEIKLLHIVQMPDSGFFSLGRKKEEDYLPDMVQTAGEHLSRIAAWLIPENVSVSQEVKVSSGSVVDEILGEKAELIIMGRKRPENQESIWAGSVTEKVIRLSRIPVISVGKLAENIELNNITFASDFKDKEVSAVLQRIFDLAELFDADLHLLYVQFNREFLNSSQMEEKIEKILEELEIQRLDLNIYVADSPEEGITRYVEENKTDLLCMYTHGRTGLAHIFRQSVAENISAYGTIPVLTYNINKDKVDRSTKPFARKMLRKRINRERKMK